MEIAEEFVLVYWHWLAFGVLLVVAEAVIPGAALLFIGAAALATGLLAWLFPDMGWELQCFLFGVLAAVAFTVSRRAFRRNKVPSIDPLLNKRYDRLIGHVVTLNEPIVDGQGRIPVNDSTFLVTGPDLPAGAKVRITDVQGAVLVVEEAK